MLIRGRKLNDNRSETLTDMTWNHIQTLHNTPN